MSINFNGGWSWHTETLCRVPFYVYTELEEIDLEETEVSVSEDEIKEVQEEFRAEN